jgi:uncharacterized protein (DUF433 family)
MTDTTPITATITKLIAAGTTGDEILAAVVRHFPDLTPAELSAAMGCPVFLCRTVARSSV